MRAAIVIPARLESTRLPGKMLLDATGTPLVCHTAEAAIRIRDAAPALFAEVIVAADDPAIMDAVESWNAARNAGVRAVMTRPDHQSGSDRIAEAAAALPPELDAILNLQGDEPDIPADAVVRLARFFKETRPDIATAVYPLHGAAEAENPALVKVVLGRDGRALYFSRAPIPFRRAEGPFAPPSYGHVGIYLYNRRSLERFVALPAGALEQTEKLEQLRALENDMDIRALVLAESPPKGIDTPEDYAAFVVSCRGG